MGFVAEGKLNRKSLSGGPPITICDAATFNEASWGFSGIIAFNHPNDPALWQVKDIGGDPEPLTILEEGESFHFLPEILPGDEAVIYSVGNRNSMWSGDWQIVLQFRETGERKLLIADETDARYVPTGHLLFMRRGILMAAPFDLDRLEVSGVAIPVLENVMQSLYNDHPNINTGSGQFSVSQTGTIAYVTGGVHPENLRTLVWVDRQGVVERLELPSDHYYHVRLSPDGNRIAFDTIGRKPHAGFYDITRGFSSRLTEVGWLDGSIGPQMARKWCLRGEKTLE